MGLEWDLGNSWGENALTTGQIVAQGQSIQNQTRLLQVQDQLRMGGSSSS